MSFDISNDAEFLQDIQSSNIDDASIDTDSIINNLQDEKSDNSTAQNQNQNIKKEEPPPTNIKSNPKKYQKNKSQTQNSNKKKPILDLSSFDFGAIDNNNEKNSNQQSTQNVLSEYEIVNAQTTAIESRITNYLDKSLSSLKSDILNEIEYIFSRKNSTSNIIDSFLLHILSEIKNEIHYLQSVPIPDQPINVSFEIDLPKTKPIIYKEFPADSFLNQISYLKSQLSQNLANIKNDISSEIKNRDSLITRIFHEEKLFSTKLRNLQDKSFSLKSTFDDIEHSIRLLSKQNFDLNEKIKDFEEESYIENMKKNTINEIRDSLNELSALAESTNRNSKNKSVLQKIADIKNEIKVISNVADDTSIQISNFFNSWRKTDYRNRIFIQQNRSDNILRFSAPPYSNYSRQSPLFSSTPKTLNESDYSLNHRITNNKPLHYSPIRVRDTPNYHVESDEDDYSGDDIFQVNNYLLNKKFSPSMSNYT